eukprot:12955823-Ditylum_brightwellii.AAC.1
MESTKKLNYFPAKHGVSKHYSPRMIKHREVLDYKCHCSFVFGEYVLGHNENNPSNTNAPRALDCIYLCPSLGQTGHDLYHLQTNSVVNCQNCTPMPITPAIIKQVHKLAALDKMPKGLKIANKANNILFDSAQIAGVDYEEQEFEDNTHDERYSSSDSSYNDDDDSLPDLMQPADRDSDSSDSDSESDSDEEYDTD